MNDPLIPGTIQAIHCGCRCSIRENNYGLRRPAGGWVYDATCALHAYAPRTLPERIAAAMEDENDVGDRWDGLS